MRYSVDYEPAESTTALFGGNSNWRGPVWFPVNHLLVEAVERFARFYGDDVTVECPTGSGQQRTLSQVADELSRRLISTFLDDAGRAPARLRRRRQAPGATRPSTTGCSSTSTSTATPAPASAPPTRRAGRASSPI